MHTVSQYRTTNDRYRFGNQQSTIVALLALEVLALGSLLTVAMVFADSMSLEAKLTFLDIWLACAISLLVIIPLVCMRPRYAIALLAKTLAAGLVALAAFMLLVSALS